MKSALASTPPKTARRGEARSRTFADVLRAALRRSGRTVIDVAADAGVATETVHRVLRGRTEPSGELLASLMVILQIQTSELVGVAVDPRGAAT